MSASRPILALGERPVTVEGVEPLSIPVSHTPSWDPHKTLWASDHAIRIGEFGVIIGHLFTRSLPSVRVEGLTPEQMERIRTTSGASLAEFWGGYVAVVRCEDSKILVTRDPSGASGSF